MSDEEILADKELLMLAARAAGIDWFDEPRQLAKGPGLHMKSGPFWNPLTDDGDALRLAVTLNLTILSDPYIGEKRYIVCKDFTVHKGYLINCEEVGGHPFTSTRRAIVRAAAEIGRSMQ
jgi:hypothetical protein